MATTMGEKLVELSNIVSGTAIEHLLGINIGGGGNAPSLNSINIINTSGIGHNDGTIELFANGGTLPYQYSIGGGFQSDNTFNGLGENIYSIYVKDASGYTDSISGIKLSAPSSNSPIISEVSIIDASTTYSSDGSIRIVGSGGDAPYQYSLNDGMYQIDDIFMGLNIGMYDITIKDNLGVTNKLSGVKVGAKATLKSSGSGGYGRGPERYRTQTKVKVKDVKFNDVEPDKKIKIDVKVTI